MRQLLLQTESEQFEGKSIKLTGDEVKVDIGEITEYSN